MVGIYLVGREIGGGYTLLGLLLGLLLGGWTLRLAGVALGPELLQSLQAGHAPWGVLWRTGRRLLAGLLLIFPGFVSDAIALILLLWPGSSRPAVPARDRDDGVIEGQWRREDGAHDRLTQRQD
jgi:UPF0716 protein FxsA